MLQARLRHGRKDIHLFPRMPALVRVDTGGGISGEDRRLRQSVSPRTRIESTLVRRCVPVSHSAPSFPKSRRQLSPLSPLAHDPQSVACGMALTPGLRSWQSRAIRVYFSRQASALLSSAIAAR